MLRYLQLDVFTARAGGGNPLGVVAGANDWSDAQMQRFAQWTDLVETTFLLPVSQTEASYRVRIFTPSREIPFAGHPSVGSAYAFMTINPQLAAAELIQECGAGLLPIRCRELGAEREIFVRAPQAQILSRGVADCAPMARVLAGLALGSLPPALVSGGRRWWLAELADERALRGWQPDFEAIGQAAALDDALGLCVFARSAEPGIDLVVRAFPVAVGIREDPASGAANGLIAAYIAQAEPAGTLAAGYRVSQGRELGRDARLTVRIEQGGSVWVGGRTVTVIDGALHWP